MTDSMESLDDDYTPPMPAAAVPTQSRPVSLASVVIHPVNPRKDLGDLAELEESIRELGVLQPPVVLPAPRVAAAWPEHAAELVDAEWVVLMGARRRTAAGNVAGDDPDATLTVLVREDGIADDPAGQLDVMTAENTARAPLTPVEEARAFAAQVKTGRGQRAIAARMGCSQGHVSKRLKLLQLPTSMLAEVERGALPISDALAYIEAAGEDQFAMLAAYKLRATPTGQHWSPSAAVRQVRQEQERQAAREALTKQAAEEGVKLIDDPYKQFGGNSWQHHLDGKKAIDKARKAGTLVAAVSGNSLSYYSTAKPKKADNRSEAEEQRVAEEKGRKEAMKARDAACARLVAAAPKVPAAAPVPLLARAVLGSTGGDAGKMATRWLRDAGQLDDAAAGLSPYQFGQAMIKRPWSVQAPAAYALALAWQEERTRGTQWRQWDATDAAYLQMLVDEADYTLTEWEQAKLAAIAEQPAVVAGETYTLGFSALDGWCVYSGDDQTPVDSTGPDIGQADVNAAQRWAGETLETLGYQVIGWQTGHDPYGHDGYTAVLADSTSEERPVDQDDDAGAPVGEYRLLHDAVDGCWMVFGGDKPAADHDGLTAEQTDQACVWATEVLADAGVTVYGWRARAGATAIEYVADLTGEG